MGPRTTRRAVVLLAALSTVLLGAPALGQEEPVPVPDGVEAPPGAGAAKPEELEGAPTPSYEPATDRGRPADGSEGATPRAGSVVPVGTRSLGIDQYHARGINGAGTAIAIVAPGFALWNETQGVGDVPAPAGTSGCPAQQPTDNASLAGTWMAEIVHDVAPAAAIHRVCASPTPAADGTTPSLANALGYAQAQGIRIVVSSLGYYNTSRGDGAAPSGTPEAIVAQAAAAGILWINTTGDAWASAWIGAFNDPDGNGIHDFPSIGEEDGFQLLAGESALVTLSWDDWPVSDEDYDLRVLLSDGSLYGSSTDFQIGSQRPRETVTVTNTSGATAVFYARVNRFSATAPNHWLRLAVTSLTELSPPTLELATVSTIAEPATSPSALAVGAWCYTAVDPDWFLSGDGPTVDGRLGPNVVGPAGVVNAAITGAECRAGQTYDQAAAGAAHVAGMAALLQQRDPGASAATLRTRATSNLVDVYAPGPDSQTGSGAVLLPAISTPAVSQPSAAEISATGIVGVQLSAAGTDGYPATWTVTGGPAHGAVQAHGGGSFTYRANPGSFTVSDSFTVVATAGGVPSAPFTVQLGACDSGYHLVDHRGEIATFGCPRPLPRNVEQAPADGSGGQLPVAGFSPRPQGDGYWIVYGNGLVQAVGQARHHGDASRLGIGPGSAERAVAIHAHPGGDGYWIVTNIGRVLPYGSAGRFTDRPGGITDLSTITLNEAIVGIAATPTGRGYWLYAGDGGLFSFGDAGFFGSVPGVVPGGRPNLPVVGMTPTPSNQGYWMVASDGGMFAFGDARFFGSIPGLIGAGQLPGGRLNLPIFAMSPSLTPTSDGYLLFGLDGGVFTFGDAAYLGSGVGRLQPPGVVAVTVR